MNFLQRWILGREMKRLDDRAGQLFGEFKASMFPMNTRMSLEDGRIVSPGDNKQQYISDGYNRNELIYTVINLILNKAILPEWHLFKVTDKSSLNKANRILSTGNISVKERKMALRLKQESLDEITNFNLQQGKWNDLLEYPNPRDTFQTLIARLLMYKLLTGDSYTWGEILSGGANQGIPNTIWSLPAHLMTINASNTFPAREAAYELFTFNQKFTVEEIMHDFFPNPNAGLNGEELYGFAPLRAFLKNIERNNSAKEASTAKFRNGGLEAIASFGDSQIASTNPQFAKAQMEALKIKLAEEYSGPTNQGKVAVSAYPVNVHNLGLSPTDLGIIDSEKWDAIMFCNGYNVPPELAGLTAKTFNNMIEAQKALILGAVMPHLDSLRRCFNRKFQSDWGFKGQNIIMDYTTECFPELEADVSKTMDWMNNLTMTTPDEERISVGLDALNIPESKEVWVKTQSGRIPLTDFQAGIVDQTLNNANGQTNMGNGNGQVSQNGQGEGGMSNGNGKTIPIKKVV